MKALAAIAYLRKEQTPLHCTYLGTLSRPAAERVFPMDQHTQVSRSVPNDAALPFEQSHSERGGCLVGA